MEIIERIIRGEHFKTRYSSHIPSYMDNEAYGEDSENYGLYPMDTIIDTTMSIYSIIGQLPHYEDGSDKVMRYWDVKNSYLIINHLEETCFFYKLCRRKNEIRWVNVDVDFYDTNILPTLSVVSDIPSTAETAYTIGDIICVNEDVELCNEFNERFRKTGVTHRYELDFMDFFRRLHKGEYADKVKIPFIEVNIPIFENYEDIGIYTSEYEKWVPKKKYYEGDLVIYNDKLYELLRGESVEEPYYRGYFNEETFITEFDDPNPSNKHWQEISTSTTTMSAVTGLCESRLSNLLPMRKTFDDYGNVMPFIYNSTTTPPSQYYDTDLQYTLKPKNIEVGAGGAIYADVITTIRTYDINHELLDTFTCSGWTAGTVNTMDLSSSTTFIEFDYVIHGEITMDAQGETIVSINPESGVRYSERYVATLDFLTATLGGNEIKFKYLKIEDMLPVNLIDEKVTWSDINFNPITVSSSVSYRIFKDDSLHGVHGITEDSEELYITRGASAAMERHYILMEVSSFDDLENYRNNYFGL